MPTIQARIYEPYATPLRLIAEKNRRPVATEVHIAVEEYLARSGKKKNKTRKP